MPLGSTVSAALSLVGITEDRVTAWIGKPCGCKDRADRLDSLDLWARRTVRGGTDSLKYLLTIISSRPPCSDSAHDVSTDLTHLDISSQEKPAAGA